MSAVVFRGFFYATFMLGLIILSGCTKDGFLKGGLVPGAMQASKHKNVSQTEKVKSKCGFSDEPCVPLEKVVDIHKEPWTTVLNVRDSVDPSIPIFIKLRDDSSWVVADRHSIIIDQGALQTYGARGLIGAVAHELGHIVLDHRRTRQHYHDILNFAFQLTSALGDDDIAFRSLLTERLVDSLVASTWKRSQELEADAKAVEILVNAGIDPYSVMFAFTKEVAKIEAAVEKKQAGLQAFLKQLLSTDEKKDIYRVGLGLNQDEQKVYAKFLIKNKQSTSDPLKVQFVIAAAEALNRTLLELSKEDHPSAKERNNAIRKILKAMKRPREIVSYKKNISLAVKDICLNRKYFLSNQGRCINQLQEAGKHEPLYYYILVKMASAKPGQAYALGVNEKVKWLEKSLTSEFTPKTAWEMLADTYFRHAKYDEVVKLAERYKKLHGAEAELPLRLLMASLAASQRKGEVVLRSFFVCSGAAASTASVTAYDQCVAATKGVYQPVY